MKELQLENEDTTERESMFSLDKKQWEAQPNFEQDGGSSGTIKLNDQICSESESK